MRNTWLARFNTVFLALLLAGGGSGLPVADALFHHLQGSAHTGNRVADGEEASGHGARCSLGVPLPTMASAGAVAPMPACGGLPFVPPLSRAPDSPRSTAVPAAARPRAPPTHIG